MSIDYYLDKIKIKSYYSICVITYSSTLKYTPFLIINSTFIFIIHIFAILYYDIDY